MHTPTHILIGTVALTKPGARAVNFAAAAGAFLPDLPMYVMFFGARFLFGMTDHDLWPRPTGLYWQEPWQSITNATHSIIVFGVILGAALWLASWPWKAFALSGLLHIAFDLPVHREDGHAHFWPLSDWVYISPVSYWDRNHYGSIVAPLETLLVVALTVVLLRRFRDWWVRVLLVLGLVSQAAPYVYFVML